jgi:hypothetical protein
MDAFQGRKSPFNGQKQPFNASCFVPCGKAAKMRFVAIGGALAQGLLDGVKPESC